MLTLPQPKAATKSASAPEPNAEKASEQPPDEAKSMGIVYLIDLQYHVFSSIAGRIGSNWRTKLCFADLTMETDTAASEPSPIVIEGLSADCAATIIR